jgi:hypothetical protein
MALHWEIKTCQELMQLIRIIFYLPPQFKYYVLSTCYFSENLVHYITKHSRLKRYMVKQLELKHGFYSTRHCLEYFCHHVQRGTEPTFHSMQLLTFSRPHTQVAAARTFTAISLDCAETIQKYIMDFCLPVITKYIYIFLLFTIWIRIYIL